MKGSVPDEDIDVEVLRRRGEDLLVDENIKLQFQYRIVATGMLSLNA